VLGHGNLLTTVFDLLKWNNAYLSACFGRSFLEKQLRTGKLKNGLSTNYASGLIVTQYKGNKVITHNGISVGNSSFLEYYPEYDMSFAMIANTGELNAGSHHSPGRRSFHQKKDRAKDQPTFAQMDHSPSIDPTAFQGYYKNARTSAGLRLIANKEFLFTNRGDTLIPIGDNTFKLQQAVVRFTGDLQKPMMLINSINFPDTIIYTRTVQPTQDSLYTIKLLRELFFGTFKDFFVCIV
jgi:hypothetical protein